VECTAILGCWASDSLSFCSYNFLPDGAGFYSFCNAKKEFTYTANRESVTIHYIGDSFPSTFKYTVEDNILMIEDSFGNLIKYIKQGEK